MAHTHLCCPAITAAQDLLALPDGVKAALPARPRNATPEQIRQWVDDTAAALADTAVSITVFAGVIAPTHPAQASDLTVHAGHYQDLAGRLHRLRSPAPRPEAPGLTSR